MSIKCKICNADVEFIALHLKDSHEGVSIGQYAKDYPDAPLASKEGEELLKKRLNEWGNNEKVMVNVAKAFDIAPFSAFSEVWGWKNSTESVPDVIQEYSFRKNLLSVVLYALTTPNEPTLLIGPTGAGKTSIVEQACARLNRPVSRLNLDGDITRADLVGQWVLTGDNTMKFQDGPLVTAMKEGRAMIVDEIDAGAAPVVLALQAVLEGKPLFLLETGEVIKPHPDFRLFATANTNGQGDDTGLYHGTQPQNYALMDRFKMTIVTEYPKANEEHKILDKAFGMEYEMRKKFIEVANFIRKAHVNGECVCTMSTRNVLNIAGKYLVFGDVKFAYEIGFLNKLKGEDKDFANEMIQKVWG